jgi:hypothetical protein
VIANGKEIPPILMAIELSLELPLIYFLRQIQ